jgi:beta-mannosidase
MTVGPWKPINLHTYKTRIVELHIRSEISELLDVNMTVDFTLSDTTPAFGSLIIKNCKQRNIFDESELMIYEGHARREFYFGPGVLDLWYPVGYGQQPSYTVEVQITDRVIVLTQSHVLFLLIELQDGNLLDVKSQKIAFRRVRVVQEKLVDQGGLSFLFEINNVRVFCGGISTVL